MNLPPLPETTLNNKVEKFYTTEQMLAYGELCLTTYKKAKAAHCGSKPKFNSHQADNIRSMNAQGHGYKQINKHYPMSEGTYTQIIKRRGAYK